MKVFFQNVADFFQLSILFGHLILHVYDGLRRSDSSDDVLALSVHEIFPEKDVFSRPRIASKGNPSGRVRPHVAEHHCTNVDSCPICHIRGDLELLPVIDSPFPHPRSEHGFYRNLHLLQGILRKFLPELLFDHRFVFLTNLSKSFWL